MTGEKQAVKIVLKRSGFDILMDLKVDEKIEAFFKQASLGGSGLNDEMEDAQEGKSKTSSKWLDKEGNGLPYYVKSTKLGELVPGTRIMDNFGNGLLDDDKVNVAFLRIVGVSEGVTIKTTDLLSVEEMKDFIKRFAKWTEEFYKNHLVDSEIIAEINVPQTEKEEILSSVN